MVCEEGWSEGLVENLVFAWSAGCSQRASGVLVVWGSQMHSLGNTLPVRKMWYSV